MTPSRRAPRTRSPPAGDSRSSSGATRRAAAPGRWWWPIRNRCVWSHPPIWIY